MVGGTCKFSYPMVLEVFCCRSGGQDRLKPYIACPEGICLPLSVLARPKNGPLFQDPKRCRSGSLQGEDGGDWKHVYCCFPAATVGPNGETLHKAHRATRYQAFYVSRVRRAVSVGKGIYTDTTLKTSRGRPAGQVQIQQQAECSVSPAGKGGRVYADLPKW